MRIGVVGINHKLADLKLREKLAKACQKWFGPLQACREEHFFILLSTCNRTEVYFSSMDLTATHTYLLSILRFEVPEEFDQKLYSYFGTDCFCHLTKVTLGLDSAIIGETEIQGQVKLAYEHASEFHSLPKDLHFLFQKSMGIAKSLRSTLQLGRGMPNLEDAILQAGKSTFQTPTTSRLLFVGASEINRKILVFLKNKNFANIYICNRSNEQSIDFATNYAINYLPWSQMNEWLKFDWIIFGTKSPEYLIVSSEIRHHSFDKKLILDLSVPRNVDPKLGLDPRITLLNIDQINRSLKTRYRHMAHVLIQAEEKVIEASQKQAANYLERNSKAQLYAMA